MIDQAIKWIKRHTLQDGGIMVHSRKRICYPEVTGYFIPTLLSIGERPLANQYADHLCAIQQPDGSFLDPDGKAPYAFDTGQVIRGWVELLPTRPELEKPLRRACDWLIQSADPATGRLLVPNGGAWGMGKRGSVSEGVHLYALWPLQRAGKQLGEPRYLDFVTRSKRWYLENIELTNFEQSHMLTHLFCYIQEALFDLGECELAKQGMDQLARYQQDNGALPGFFDAPWLCAPGQIQAASVWYKLGDRARADRTLAFAEKCMNPSGGFFGSYGVAATYFPAAELSWAVKFYIDACNARVTQFFDAEHAVFPTQINAEDGRLRAISEFAGDLNGRTVLDVGCGKGRFAASLRQRFPRALISGVDISAELLKSVPPGIPTRLGSMLQLPWPDASFDVLYCVEALEHAQSEAAALREMNRLLKPGGHLVVIDKNAERWGAFKTPAWEKWFKPEPLTAQLRALCGAAEWKFVAYDKKPADGLFVAWHGHKTSPTSEPVSAAPAVAPVSREKLVTEENAQPRPGAKRAAGTTRALDSEEWHEAITAGATPGEIAARVRKGNVPEWVKPVLELTQPGDVVLEQGSGTAAMSAWLALQGRKIVLLDYSQPCLDFGLAVFRELGLEPPPTHCVDLRQPLPLGNGTVDFVWSSGVLEHFSDDEIVHILSESRRVARKQVFSLVPNARSLAYRIGKSDQEQGGRWKYGYEDPKHSLAQLFARAGLKSVREFTVGPLHSLNFLDSAELAPLRQKLDGFLRHLPAPQLQQLDQGYLLGTTGKVREPRRLAVVPSDPLEAYERAGYASWLKGYYNPAGCFDEVYCLSPKESVARCAHGMQVIPTTEGELAARIRELNIDVVRAYGGYWACDFATAAKVPGVPVIVSVHDQRADWLHDSIRQADQVIAVSDVVRRLVVARGVAESQIVTLPNRVDFEVFRRIEAPQRRAAFEQRFPGKHRILHVGRKSAEKNLDTVIRTLPLLGADYSVIAVGRGDVRPYAQLAKELGVSARCHFIESVPSGELPEYYSFCDCFCTPSRQEGFGIVFIEALACEALVITSDLAPMNEVVRHHENGLLVKELEHPATLAAAINLACTDTLLRARLTLKARDSVRRFERKDVDSLEASMYEVLLGKQATPNARRNSPARPAKPAKPQPHARHQLLQARLRASKAIVDLGCGNNPVAGATVAVDLHVAPAERALGHGPTIDVAAFARRGIRFVNARIDGPLPFRDKEFDFAYSHHVFEHLDDPATACREMVRIAKAGAIITPAPFAEFAFGRPYHRWLVTERAGKLIFLNKRTEEDRPFGLHPEFAPGRGWFASAETNPFDILLNDGEWYREPESSQFERLSARLRELWYSHSPVIETIFLWEDSFECLVLNEP